MQTAPSALNAVITMIAKVFAVALLVGALGGYAGPTAINAHDNILLAVGVLCFLAAGVGLVMGWFWVGASLRAILDQRNIRP